MAHYAAARFHQSLDAADASSVSAISTLLCDSASSRWLLVFAWLAQSTPHRNYRDFAFRFEGVGSLAKEGLWLD